MQRRLFAVAAALAVVACASVAFVVVSDSGLVGAAVRDFAETAGALLAAIACAWAATRTPGRARVAWSLLAASAASWGAGQVAATVYEVGLGVPVPFPGLPDLGSLAAIPLAFAAIRAFWTPPRGTSVSWRVWLDAAIIAMSLTFTAWALGLSAVWLDKGDSLVDKFFELAYPVGDILIGTVLILALRRATHRQHVRMFLLLGGLAAISLSDSAFALLTANGGSELQGSVLTTGWLVGYLMIALAAIWPQGPVRATADQSPADLWQLALPWLTILAAGASAVYLAVSGRQLDGFLTLLGGALASLLTLSMILTSRDFLGMLVRSRKQEATLAQVIDSAPAGVVRIGTDMRIIEANSRFKVILGSNDDPSGQLVTRYFSEVAATHFMEKIRALSTGAVDAEGDSDAQRPNGSRIWMHWSATAVPTPEGDADYFIAMFEDTTARHEADAAASANLELMQRLNSLKTEFLQSVSHEFKTALIGIQGFSEFMRDADQLDVNDARAFAADIHRDAERLDRMVTEMLALDHVETTRADLHIAAIDMNEVIRREADATRQQVHGNVLVLVLEPALPLVSGDGQRLSEVVRTLLSDAVRYSPEGGRITVTTTVSGETVTVGVRDEGVAARADFDNRLFGKSDLYANNPIRKVIGTGLGLGIVRQVVEMHGGRVWVDEVDGAGSEFHFTVPVAPAVPLAAAGARVA
jgi:PAS domain S-box-containing protein